MLSQELVPQMRAIAETVYRLVRRDKSQTAVHLISRMLSELELQQRAAGPGSSGLGSAAAAMGSEANPGLPSSLVSGLAGGLSSQKDDREQRAYLLNLRGVIHAQRGQESQALLDLTQAHELSASWPVPLYNLGLLHKQARRWSEAQSVLLQALQCVRKQAGRLSTTPALSSSTGLSRAVLWNLGLAQTALKQTEEARATWQACGVAPPRGAHADLGLAQLSLPTTGPYSVERVWVQRLDPARARILSVVRYGAPCQFGDVVLCDNSAHNSSFTDGLIGSDGDEPETEEGGGLVFLDSLERAGYALHVVQGGPATPTQAMTLTEKLRENGLHIEVWSLTMRLPGSPPPPENTEERAGTPLCAGLVLPAGPLREPMPLGPIRIAEGQVPDALVPNDAQRTAEKAVLVLNAAARELGLSVFSPTLMAAAGDELGAARHKRALKRAVSA
jgi:hypothetical protein